MGPLRQDSTIPSQALEKQALLESLPPGDEELYSTWKRLEAHKDFLELQEVITMMSNSSPELKRSCRNISAMRHIISAESY